MKILCLNTYAGSLLLGASAIPGTKIIGSYEDCGFGQPIAKANFPDVEHIRDLEDWPEQDLRDVTVLAHPPCSAFSVQNSSWNARGANAEAFKCTRRVLDYAMGNHALAIAIESVVGAMGGAWEVHQSYADQHGYNLYRILQNGAAFGPQWRERFWVVYVRRDAARPTMTWRLRPTWQRTGQRLKGVEHQPSLPTLNKALEALEARFAQDDMIGPKGVELIFGRRDEPWPATGLLTILRREFFDGWLLEDIGRRLHLEFASSQPCFLNPDQLAGTLLGVTWWHYLGANLSVTGYKRIMGFPDDYIFPEERRNFTTSMRTFLSKGVIPQVASWILGNIITHLTGRGHDTACPCHACKAGGAWQLDVEPNHIADFRFRKSRWLKEQLPELRHFYEPEVYDESAL